MNSTLRKAFYAGLIFSALNFGRSYAQDKIHVVKEGESLSKIAQKYDLDWKELAKLNTIDEPYTISPGDTLKLKEEEIELSFSEKQRRKREERRRKQEEKSINLLKDTKNRFVSKPKEVEPLVTEEYKEIEEAPVEEVVVEEAVVGYAVQANSDSLDSLLQAPTKIAIQHTSTLQEQVPAVGTTKIVEAATVEDTSVVAVQDTTKALEPEVALSVGEGLKGILHKGFEELRRKDFDNYWEIKSGLKYLEDGVKELKESNYDSTELILTGLDVLDSAYNKIKQDSIIGKSLSTKIDFSLLLLADLTKDYAALSEATDSLSTEYSEIIGSVGETLSEKDQPMLEAEKLNFSRKKEVLDSLVNRLHEVIDVGRKIPTESVGFSELDSLAYEGNDDLEEIGNVLESHYKPQKEYFEGLDPELFNDWFDGSFLPLLNYLDNLYSKELKKFEVDGDRLRDILGEGYVPDAVEKRREDLETLVSRIRSLKEGKITEVVEESPVEEEVVEEEVPIDTTVYYRDIPGYFGAPKKVEESIAHLVVPKKPGLVEKHVKPKHYKKHTAIVGASLNYNPSKPSFYSGIFGLEFNGENRVILELGRGSKSGESSLEDVGEVDPYYGFHGHGYDNVDRDIDFERTALMFGRRLGKSVVDLGPVRYNERTVENHSVRNELHNAEHEVLEFGDSYTRSEKGSSTNYGANVSFGTNVYKNLDAIVGVDLVKGYAPIYSAKAHWKFGKKRK